MLFEGSFAGYSCLVGYQFDGDVLVSGNYYFNEANDALDAVIYTTLQEKLAEKYGPEEELVDWKHPAKRVQIDTVGDLGEAVAAGYLNVISIWETVDSHITLALGDSDDSYDAHVFLIYRDAANVSVSQSESEEDFELL